MKREKEVTDSMSVGGQALLEGLLMMGGGRTSIAVRDPKGEIIVKTEFLPPKDIFSKIPVIRGVFNFIRQMVVGVKALMYSAEFMDLEDEEGYKPSKFEAWLDRVLGNKIKDIIIYFSVFLALIIGIGLFMLLPNFIAGFFSFIDRSTRTGVILSNVAEGLIRITVFLSYISLTSRIKDINRVWQYHGAEHKAIHCYENKEDLTVENVQRYTTKHPRCGTSFLFIVMIISIIVFSFAGWHNRWINLLLRLILIPLVAGISYELLKFSGKSKSPIMAVINYPGLLLQKLTTKEPDDLQVEVAIAALEGVLNGEKKV